jgi:sodium/bile acid cotransporter 7
MTAYAKENKVHFPQVVEEDTQMDSDEERGPKPAAAATGDSADQGSRVRDAFRKFLAFYHANEFPFLVLLAIGLAKAYPPLGADYLQPQITGTYTKR